MKNIHSQKGTVLFVSLIILLILTVIGLTSMQNSILQEKMTAAVRDGRVAFEGAEATLHFVEQEVIEGFVTTGLFDNSGCYYQEGEAPKQDENGKWKEKDVSDAWVDSDVWTTTGSCIAASVNARGTSVVGGSDGSLAEAPRYFVELAGTLQNEDATKIQVFTYNNNAGGGDVTGFRIIARSVGSTATSQKFLSSYYSKRF